MGCFRVLAIVRNAVVDMGVQTSFQDSVLASLEPRSRITASYGGSASYGGFGETPYWFSQWLCQFLFPPAPQRGPYAPHPHQCLLPLFENSNSKRREATARCRFDLPFPSNVESSSKFLSILLVGKANAPSSEHTNTRSSKCSLLSTVYATFLSSIRLIQQYNF